MKKKTRFLNRREVERMVGMPRSSLYQAITEGRFPPADPRGQALGSVARRRDPGVDGDAGARRFPAGRAALPVQLRRFLTAVACTRESQNVDRPAGPRRYCRSFVGVSTSA